MSVSPIEDRIRTLSYTKLTWRIVRNVGFPRGNGFRPSRSKRTKTNRRSRSTLFQERLNGKARLAHASYRRKLVKEYATNAMPAISCPNSIRKCHGTARVCFSTNSCRSHVPANPQRSLIVDFCAEWLAVIWSVPNLCQLTRAQHERQS